MLRAYRGILPTVDPSADVDESVQDGTIVHVQGGTHPTTIEVASIRGYAERYVAHRPDYAPRT